MIMTKDELIKILSDAVDSERIDTEEGIEQGHFSHEEDAYESGIGDAWGAVKAAIESLPSGTVVA